MQYLFVPPLAFSRGASFGHTKNVLAVTNPDSFNDGLLLKNFGIRVFMSSFVPYPALCFSNQLSLSTVVCLSAYCVLLILTRDDFVFMLCHWYLKLVLEPSLFLRKIWQKKPKHHWKEVNKTLPHISPFKLVMKKQHLNWFHN